MQEEFYSVAFRKKLYRSLDELQTDLDVWLREYNEKREHSGKYCYGKTPWQTFLDSKHLAEAKMLDSLTATSSADADGEWPPPISTFTVTILDDAPLRNWHVLKQSSW